MGYPMAKNLRSKIPASSKLIVCEVVKQVRDQFVETTEGEISTAENPQEVATQAVS
jgi:3-hydroxyisobutyrate/3-hydroxypropionate dehydrogenase